MRLPPLAPLLLGLALALGLAGPAGAGDTVVPHADGLVLDGRLDEPAWAAAASLPVGPTKAQARPGVPAPPDLVPTVRVLSSGGMLWLGIEIPEDVGLGTGVKGMIGIPSTKSAADAFSFAYAPEDIRSPRYVARGPRGAGRYVYRIRGAIDASTPGRSRMELAIPIVDLDLPAPDAPLRLGLAVNARRPDAIAWSPPGAAFQDPAAWSTLKPPEGGWGPPASVDAAALQAEDANDEKRQAAFGRYLTGIRQQVPPGKPEELEARIRKLAIEPLEEALALQPDLALFHVLEADVLRSMGKTDEAMAALEAALKVVPGLREALFQWLIAYASAHAEPPPGSPTDYPGALAKLDADAARLTEDYQKDGIALSRGILLYKRGDFAEAKALLEPLAKRYPDLPLAVFHAERAAKYVDGWRAEEQARQHDAEKADLPRARIATSKGDVVVELYLDDVPNTVKNFVWLAQHGFYDGTLFHRVIPFFMAQGGDPFSMDEATKARVGMGGPCYAIPTEPGHRKPVRGALAMARMNARNTEGSQFFIITGTAAHLEGEYSVFGRVLEGQEVVDGLLPGDKIVKVEVLRTRPGVEYRPTTTAGTPAPEPKRCGPDLKSH